MNDVSLTEYRQRKGLWEEYYNTKQQLVVAVNEFNRIEKRLIELEKVLQLEEQEHVG